MLHHKTGKEYSCPNQVLFQYFFCPNIGAFAKSYPYASGHFLKKQERDALPRGIPLYMDHNVCF